MRLAALTFNSLPLSSSSRKETKPLTESATSAGLPMLLDIPAKEQKKLKPQKSARIQAPPWPNNLDTPAMAKIQAPPTSPNRAKTNKSYSTPSISIRSLIYTVLVFLVAMVFCQSTASFIKFPTKSSPIVEFHTKKVKQEVLPISPLAKLRSRRHISITLSRSDYSSTRRKKKKRVARLGVDWCQGPLPRPGCVLDDWMVHSLDAHQMTGWWQGPRPRPGCVSKFRSRTSWGLEVM